MVHHDLAVSANENQMSRSASNGMASFVQKKSSPAIDRHLGRVSKSFAITLLDEAATNAPEVGSCPCALVSVARKGETDGE